MEWSESEGRRYDVTHQQSAGNTKYTWFIFHYKIKFEFYQKNEEKFKFKGLVRLFTT